MIYWCSFKVLSKHFLYLKNNFRWNINGDLKKYSRNIGPRPWQNSHQWGREEVLQVRVQNTEYRIQSPDYRFIYFSGQPSPASTGLVTGRSRLTPYCRPWDELAATPLRWRSTTSSTRLMTAQGWSLSRTSALSSMTRKVLKLTLNTKWQCLIVHEVTFYFWKGFKNIL